MWIPDEGQSTKNNREIINPLYQLWLEFFSHGAVLWKIGMRGRYGSCHHLTEQVREAKILPTMTKDTRRLQTHKCTHNNTHTHTHTQTHTHSYSNAATEEKTAVSITSARYDAGQHGDIACGCEFETGSLSLLVQSKNNMEDLQWMESSSINPSVYS